MNDDFGISYSRQRELIGKFSSNFKDYSSDLSISRSLVGEIAKHSRIGYSTATHNIRQLRNNDVFNLSTSNKRTFPRLCKILEVLPEDFLKQNIDFLYLANPSFREYREEYILSKKK